MDEYITVFIFLVIAETCLVTKLILITATTTVATMRRTIMSPSMGGANRRCLTGVAAPPLRLLARRAVPFAEA